MSLQSQIKNMKLLSELLGQDLGYIYGERESGPNGAKKQFLSTGRAFLSALGKDLGFTEQKVSTNKAGIAVSGEVYLRGMWGGSGVKLELSQGCISDDVLHIWPIESMDARNTGRRQAITLAELKAGNYGGLVAEILRLREDWHGQRKAA